MSFLDSEGTASGNAAPISNRVEGKSSPDDQLAVSAGTEGAYSSGVSKEQEREEIYSVRGLLGQVKGFLYKSAPRQSDPISEAGAIAYLTGICGNAYNVSSTGLNQYIAYLATTGIGKDANADGFNKLISSTWASSEPYPYSGAELISSSGLIKWMNRFSCNHTLISEFPKKLVQWSNPRNQHDYATSRVVLQLYSKSGRHGSFDPLAFSDPDKVTKRIDRVSLTLLAEGTTEGFLEAIDQAQIADGMLPRFMVYEHKEPRAYLNKGHDKVIPNAPLIENLRSFMATCNAIRSSEQRAYDVPFTTLAEAKFDEFDRWTTDAINGGAGVAKQLWNRAHLKALKLAALAAVSDNWNAPLIRLAHAVWATNLIAEQTNNLIAKFERGEVGAVGGNQLKQIREVKRVITEYIRDPDLAMKYHPKRPDLQQVGCITFAHIQQRLAGTAAFRNDKMGALYALNRVMSFLTDSDILREVPKKDMLAKFNIAAKAYVIADGYSIRDWETT